MYIPSACSQRAGVLLGSQARNMVRLLRNFGVVSGPHLTHPWDASAYLIEGEEPTLIDCGSRVGYKGLKRELREAGYAPKDIRRVIATHGHWDHLSGLECLRQEADVELLIHEADRRQVETGDYDLTAAFLYGEPFAPQKVDGVIAEGDVLNINGLEFAVYHTPGHSPGSVSLLTEIDGVRLLIAGDTLWGGAHTRVGSNMEDWTRSLDHLLELDFDVMTTGHIPPELIFDARREVADARMQLGLYFNPWFKPFNKTVRHEGEAETWQAAAVSS